jgi:hypothetical protein
MGKNEFNIGDKVIIKVPHSLYLAVTFIVADLANEGRVITIKEEDRNRYYEVLTSQIIHIRQEELL